MSILGDIPSDLSLDAAKAVKKRWVVQLKDAYLNNDREKMFALICEIENFDFKKGSFESRQRIVKELNTKISELKQIRSKISGDDHED